MRVYLNRNNLAKVNEYDAIPMPEAYKIFGVQRMLSGIRDSQNDFDEYTENSLEVLSTLVSVKIEIKSKI